LIDSTLLMRNSRRKLEGFGRPNGESDRSRNRKRGVLTTFPPSWS